jgi:hypothetical protein
VTSAFGIQNDLLFWACTDHSSLNGVHVVQTAYSRYGNFDEFDGRPRNAVLTRNKKDAKEEKHA